MSSTMPAPGQRLVSPPCARTDSPAGENRRLWDGFLKLLPLDHSHWTMSPVTEAHWTQRKQNLDGEARVLG